MLRSRSLVVMCAQAAHRSALYAPQGGMASASLIGGTASMRGLFGIGGGKQPDEEAVRNAEKMIDLMATRCSMRMQTPCTHASRSALHSSPLPVQQQHSGRAQVPHACELARAHCPALDTRAPGLPLTAHPALLSLVRTAALTCSSS
jgi:hypothetical protein